MLISPVVAGLLWSAAPQVLVANPASQELLAGAPPVLTQSTPESRPGCSDLRLNTFTQSSQDNVSVDAAPDGSLVAVWHSRRQEGGTYGVRARRVTKDGAFLSEEVAVNATTEGMQVEPSLSLDPTGAAWFAWVSRGQDGSGDGVYARRFTADLKTAGTELRMDGIVEGDQSEPAIVALRDGRALCIWTGPATDTTDDEQAKPFRGQRAAYARFIDSGGKASGPRITLDVGTRLGARTPTVARGKDGALVAFSTYDASGQPAGIYLVTVGEDGATGAPLRIDEGSVQGLPVEPSLSSTEGRAAIAWLEAERGTSNGEYSILWRNVSSGRAEAPAMQLGPIHGIEAPEQGYTSGLAIAARGADTAIVWSRYLESEAGTPRLYSAVTRTEFHDGQEHLTTIRRAQRSTGAIEGKQAMAVGGASQRALLLGDGELVAVWHGDAELGDSSGAHLSFVDLPDEDPHARVLADLSGGPAMMRVAQTTRATQGPPAPHDPPTFNPRDIDTSVDLNSSVRRSVGGDIDFRAFTSTGWTPPDPEMAVGMNHIVAIVNGGIRFFDKQGTLLFNDQIEGSGGFWGSVGATSFVFDPEVVWDPFTDRFVALAAERQGSNSYYLLAISDDGDPTGNWFKYRLDVTPIIGANIDSVNLSVDSQAIYLTADFFNPTRYFIYIVDKASVLNGGTPVTTNTTVAGRHSMGAPVNYDAGADSAYFVFAPESSTSSSIRIYSVDDPLGTPSVQFTNLAVPTYAEPADPPQMGTSSRPDLFEARFWSAVLRNGKLWATHHQGNPAKQRWYEIDMAGWPQSGQAPSLVQSGDVDAGPGTSTFFGSIWVNDAGAMAMTFAMSASNSFISMARVARGAADAPGTTGPIETIITSTSPETSGRWGDYSATNDDPADPGRFWVHHEYREGGWRTRLASFEACNGGTENYCATSPNSVGTGATIIAAGSVNVSDNSLQLISQGAAPGVFGVFFYGDARANAPTGDGVRCVGGNLFRLGVTQSDIFGGSFFDVDITAPQTPAAMITAGSTWNFQYFYRDVVPGGSGLNFSDAVAVMFCD